MKTRFILVSVIIFFLNSCASLYTSKSHYDDIDYFLEIGDDTAALEALKEVKESQYKKKDRVLYYLEEGMLYRYSGQYANSNDSLTKAEYAMEDLLIKSISKGILSGVLNDNALDYTGEDYEDIYINIFKALNFLQLNQQDNALIEIRRVNDKLNKLEYKYRAELGDLNNSEDVEIPEADFNFYNDAMARYLGILAYRMDGSFDDSRIERDYFIQSYKLQPSIYNFPQPDIPEIDGSGTLVNIFSYSGFSPEKVADTIMASTGRNSIFLGVSSDNDYDSSSYLGFSSIAHTGLSEGMSLKLQFPRLVSSTDPVSYVEVFIDDYYYGTLELIESIDNVATETFKVKQPLIVGKTVIRAISKAVISELSESAVSDEFGRGFGLLTGLVGDIYMQVSENSDLRISRYFPSMIRGLELKIEPGVYDFSLVYYDYNNNPIYQDNIIGMEVRRGGLNLIESHLLRKQ